MRSLLRSLTSGVVVGCVALGSAWAAVGLMPTGGPPIDPTSSVELQRAMKDAVPVELGLQLPGEVFRVGASDVSIAPKSIAEDGPWMRHGIDGNCEGQSTVYTPTANPSCLRTFDSNWARSVDPEAGLGVFVRAISISNGKDTVVFAVMDTIGWFAGFDPSVCTGCGSTEIAASLEMTLGIPAKNIVISSTHTHASGDTVMASPSWYFDLIRDATKQAIIEAVGNARLATIQTGTTPAKAFNTDRRIVTRAIPDYELGWLRAVDQSGETISTIVNFSVHPTITAGNRDLHSGLVGHLAKRLKETWGGNTLFMPAGLGDQTVNRGFGRDGFGYGLADLVLESAATNAHTLTTNEIVSDRRIVRAPADNLSLSAANVGRVFVRDTTIPSAYADGPSTSVQQKGGARSPSCVGAGPLSVLTPVGGIRIGAPGQLKQRGPDGEWDVLPGDLGDAIVIMQTPGEIFSSISATTKDYLSRARNVMVLGLANDTIGYIIPYEQYDNRSANAAGLLQPSLDIANYEESLSTGRCTGDQVQNALLEIGQFLGVMGDGEGR